MAAAVDRLRAAGDFCRPGAQMAPVAYRRLASYERRNARTRSTPLDRTDDLVRGLARHFEPDRPWTPDSDLRAWASVLIAAYEEHA